MNNFKLTYGEVLKLLVDNLDSTQFLSHLDDEDDCDDEGEAYWLCYHYKDYEINFYLEDFTYYSTSDGKNPYSCFRPCFSTRKGKHSYLNLGIPCATDIPKTKEEWFNFGLIYQETKADFENYLKLVEHLNNEKNKLR